MVFLGVSLRVGRGAGSPRLWLDRPNIAIPSGIQASEGARPTGFEPVTFGFVDLQSVLLTEGSSSLSHARVGSLQRRRSARLAAEELREGDEPVAASAELADDPRERLVGGRRVRSAMHMQDEDRTGTRLAHDR